MTCGNSILVRHKTNLKIRCLTRVELRRWSEVHTIGDKPTGRQLHTGVMYDGEMWVFGGYDSATYYDDLYKFNFGK